MTIQPALLAEIDAAALADDLTRSQWLRTAARKALLARTLVLPPPPRSDPFKRKLARR